MSRRRFIGRLVAGGASLTAAFALVNATGTAAFAGTGRRRGHYGQGPGHYGQAPCNYGTPPRHDSHAPGHYGKPPRHRDEDDHHDRHDHDKHDDHGKGGRKKSRSRGRRR